MLTKQDKTPTRDRPLSKRERAGIQAVLNKDWPTLTEAFIRSGFFGTPIMYRDDEQSAWRVGSREQLTCELQGK